MRRARTRVEVLLCGGEQNCQEEDVYNGFRELGLEVRPAHDGADGVKPDDERHHEERGELQPRERQPEAEFWQNGDRQERREEHRAAEGSELPGRNRGNAPGVSRARAREHKRGGR